MSYIGQTLPADTFQGFTTDSFTGDGSATTFTLSKAPFSENGLIVVINNVIQKPTTNFTVSGTTLTIVGTAVASGDVIYATHLSGVIPSTLASKLDTNGVSDALILDADADTTISADTDDQIDIKIAGADDIKITANKFELLSGTSLDMDGLSTSVATGDIIAVAGKVGNLTVANNTSTVMVLDTEVVDRGGNFNTSNGRFVVPKAGVYHIIGATRCNLAANRLIATILKNGSDIGGSVGTLTGELTAVSTAHQSVTTHALVDLAVDDYIELSIYHNKGSSETGFFQSNLLIYRVGTSS